MRQLFVLFLAFALTVPVDGLAASKPADGHTKADGHGKPKDGHEAPEEKNKGLFGSEDNVVHLPTIIAPVTYRGAISEYLYMYLVAVTDAADKANAVKAKLPHVQDALVREAHAAALAKPDEAHDADVAALLTAMQARINEIVGAPHVSQIAVDRIDHAPY